MESITAQVVLFTDPEGKMHSEITAARLTVSEHLGLQLDQLHTNHFASTFGDANEHAVADHGGRQRVLLVSSPQVAEARRFCEARGLTTQVVEF